MSARHSWGDPVRPDLNNTFRTCKKCLLVRITRHEADNRPMHWVEFAREGHKVVTEKTPACEAA